MGQALSIDQLGLAIEFNDSILPSKRSYRPPRWPPPRDWVCIEDANGNPVSRWGDPIWDLSPWANKSISLNFGDGPMILKTSSKIDTANADLFRLAMTWRIWGYRSPRAVTSVINIFKTLKPIFSVCSNNGILASELSRYPRVIEKLIEELAPSTFNKVINELHNLLSAEQFLGFTILDRVGIAQLKASDPGHMNKQTEYIPPRIYRYQIKRLKDFIDDFLIHQKKLEQCYRFCMNAYSESANEERKRKMGSDYCFHLPFSGDKPIYGTFLEIAEQFGINDLLQKWVGLDPKLGIRLLTKYLNLTSYVGLAYILNFTLARISEGMSLRFNCFKWHDDDVYGQVALIEGETTKTIHNQKALWVTSPSVEKAIIVMQSAVKMRSKPFSPKKDMSNTFLINLYQEPWMVKGKNLLVRPTNFDFSTLLSHYPLLFETTQTSITEDDFKIAIATNPTLDQNIFQIGKPWRFSWHQLRRTGAVNMFSSGEISDASIQLQLKHLSPLMTQYYGRGHTALALNEDVKSLIVNAQYEAMGKNLVEANSDRFISPFGPEHKERLLSDFSSSKPVNLLAVDKVLQYEKAARAQKINFRVTAVGACMKNGRCDGDGFSALGDCAGGDDRAPCANALFDRNRAEANKNRLAMVIQQIESTKPDTPRYRHLEQERRGLENYFAFIK